MIFFTNRENLDKKSNRCITHLFNTKEKNKKKCQNAFDAKFFGKIAKTSLKLWHFGNNSF
jgi:hypothetical protein